MTVKCLKQSCLSALSHLVCTSLGKPQMKPSEAEKYNSFSLRANRKRRRSTDEGSTKQNKKLKLSSDDSYVVYSSHDGHRATDVSDATDNKYSSICKSAPKGTSVRDLSICLKEYLSALPDKIWTALYYEVVHNAKDQSGFTTPSDDESTEGTCPHKSARRIAEKLEQISEVFICPKLIEFDIGKLEIMSHAEKSTAFQKLKYCTRLQQLIACAVPAEVQIPRNIFIRFVQIRRLDLTGGEGKPCFYWAFRPIALHCPNITHLKITYNPDLHPQTDNDATSRAPEDVWRNTLSKDTCAEKGSRENVDRMPIFNSDSSNVDRNLVSKNENFQNFGNPSFQCKNLSTAVDYSVSCFSTCQHLKSIFLFNFGRKCESSALKNLILSLPRLEYVYHKELVNALSDIYIEHAEINTHSYAASLRNVPTRNRRQQPQNNRKSCLVHRHGNESSIGREGTASNSSNTEETRNIISNVHTSQNQSHGTGSSNNTQQNHIVSSNTGRVQTLNGTPMAQNFNSVPNKLIQQNLKITSISNKFKISSTSAVQNEEHISREPNFNATVTTEQALNGSSRAPSSVQPRANVESLQRAAYKLPLRRLSFRVNLPYYGEQRIYASDQQLVYVSLCCPDVVDLTVVAPVALHRLLQCLDLRVLTLIQSPYDPPLSDSFRCTPARQLQQLSLSEILLSHSDVACLAHACSVLEVFCVRNCGLKNDFTSFDVQKDFTVEPAFANVREMEVSEPDDRSPWCFGATFSRLLLQGSRKLQKLKLEFKCSDFDPRDELDGESLVTALGEKRELEFLEFISPPLLSRESVSRLLELSPKLRHLGKRSTWPFGYEMSYDMPLAIDFT